LCIDRINLVERYLNAGKLACENPERQANQSQLIALLAQQSVDVPKTELLRVITMEQGPQRS